MVGGGVKFRCLWDGKSQGMMKGSDRNNVDSYGGPLCHTRKNRAQYHRKTVESHAVKTVVFIHPMVQHESEKYYNIPRKNINRAIIVFFF